MAVYENVNGVIRQVNNIYENVNGVIRQVNARYQNVNGVIRQTYGAQTTIIDANGYWKAPSDVVINLFTATSQEHIQVSDTSKNNYYCYNFNLASKYSMAIYFPTDKYKGKTLHIDKTLCATSSGNNSYLKINLQYVEGTGASPLSTFWNEVASCSASVSNINYRKLTSNIEFVLTPTISRSAYYQKYIALVFYINGDSTTLTTSFAFNNMYIK